MSELSDWRKGLSTPALNHLQHGLKPPEWIRRGNPGQLLYSNRYIWRGQCGVGPGQELSFLEPAYGIRAMSIQILMGFQHFNKRTVHQITQWYLPNTLLGNDHIITYLCDRLNTAFDVPFDIDVKGRQLAMHLIGFLNGVIVDGKPFHDWYDYPYLRDAVGASHLI